MGRKRLTKQCTDCLEPHERIGFLRSEWEKEVDSVVRRCRSCDLVMKKSREEAVLLQHDAILSLPLDSQFATLFPPEEPLFEDDVFDDLFDFAEEKTTTTQVSSLSKEQARSLQAKRRRAKINSLFSCLAQEVGLSQQADRITILEQTLQSLKQPEVTKKMRVTSSLQVLPLLTMSDVAKSAEEDLLVVTHAELA